ncbi:heparinase II/III-family protein [Alcaligenaceae bacterium]|nr:heparinase II/III-family protein [Alcaligenaceae bacterium]
MSNLSVKALTALRLGLPNLARAMGYKVGVRTGINPVRSLAAVTPVGPFFSALQPEAGNTLLPRAGWYASAQAFGIDLAVINDAPPNWLAGCLSGQTVPAAGREWWRIPDFAPMVGDIKTVWEASRFDWVLACVQHHLVGNANARQRLESWLSDWLVHNPPYNGPNWKCGQEASIRVMHLAMASHMLGEIRQSLPGLQELIRAHLLRIAPTIQYAMAQDNNHGTSEAAALFIGGSWLTVQGDQQAAKWAKMGRKWLENRAARLIEADGSFSQYSLNYHRVMLDTLGMAELWRSQLELPAFSSRFYHRAKAATDWLRAMVQAESGDGPNLGANDGARLLPLTDSDYRDYRPSVQLASVLFLQARAYGADGSWNLPLAWLSIDLPTKVLPPVASAQFDQGGYVVIRKGPAMAMLRYPRFRFRPSQADALHLDFWLAGENWLRDAGTFSYNTEPQWLKYFPGTAAHNTVQFDDRDQMPRLSRFLFGDWLKTSTLEPLNISNEEQSCAAGYRDRQGCSHIRKVVMSENSLVVTDNVSAFRQRAVLRWRLKPGEWLIDRAAQTLTLDGFTFTVAANMPVIRFELVEGWESRYYLQKTPLPVLEIEIGQAAELVSTFKWVA